ncbi:hypothetical protein [Alkalitalea saponilacus]|nr:hypothetical protein [Alkalitalea saponilacus]ASB48431.1 hypothetical protein CDL62_04395 [Alkalitalea saponilacus]
MPEIYGSISFIKPMDKDKKIWSKELPFKVPEGYFNEFESNLFQKINIEEKEEVVTPVKKLSVFAPWIGMAAAFLIIALVYKQLPERIFPDTFMQTESVQSIEFYQVTPADYFKEYELLEFISETESLIILPDSTFFDAIDEEELIMLTLFY